MKKAAIYCVPEVKRDRVSQIPFDLEVKNKKKYCITVNGGIL